MDELPRLIAAHPCLRWSSGHTQVELVPYEPSHDDAATHAYAVPFVASSACIATRRGDGRWTLPGGTRVSGESWGDTLRRELLEEAGCALDAYRPFASFRVDAGGEPTFRIVCLASVHRVQPPADPDGPRGIVEVRMLAVEQAVELVARDHLQYAAVYTIAGALWNAR